MLTFIFLMSLHLRGCSAQTRKLKSLSIKVAFAWTSHTHAALQKHLFTYFHQTVLSYGGLLALR